jgi:hypothetical protein
MISPFTRRQPCLDPGFLPAVVWKRAYTDRVRNEKQSREACLVVERPDGSHWSRRIRLLPDRECYKALNWTYVERLAKFLLWTWGGNILRVEGAPEVLAALRRTSWERPAFSMLSPWRVERSCWRAKRASAKALQEGILMGAVSALIWVAVTGNARPSLTVKLSFPKR